MSSCCLVVVKVERNERVVNKKEPAGLYIVESWHDNNVNRELQLVRAPHLHTGDTEFECTLANVAIFNKGSNLRKPHYKGHLISLTCVISLLFTTAEV